MRAEADTRARATSDPRGEVATTAALMPVIDAGGGPSPTVSIGTSESAASSEPWLPPPRWCGRRGRRTPSRARPRRAPRRRSGSASAAAARARPSGSVVEKRVVLVAVAPRRRAGRPPRSSTIPAAGWPSSRSATPPRLVGVDHRRAVRRGDAGRRRRRGARRARPSTGRGRSRRSRRSARGTRPARRRPPISADTRRRCVRAPRARRRARPRARRSRSPAGSRRGGRSRRA